MSIWSYIGTSVRNIVNISDDVDTVKASQTIRSIVHFRGPNAWILAFAIIIASVGLNVNSTAVIIGAMLISPLMGPIFGVGLGLGVNDTTLLRSGLKNLVVMLVISLLASFLYFLISPLKLVNPTELLARTNPTIYDVLIALFGGAAGIFEMCRKDKGTVLSGVAIATALMPPICTAGYGLAHFELHYFFGALYLFLINTVFIILSTYLMVKYLRFPEVGAQDEAKTLRNRRAISVFLVLMIIPSLWSAFVLVRNNNFTQRVDSFVAANRTLPRSYIYDYKIDTRRGGKVEIFMGGEPLNAGEKEYFLSAAQNAGIRSDQVVLREQSYNGEKASETEKIIQGFYDRAGDELARRDAQIGLLNRQIEQMKSEEIPYEQISREVRSQYPEIGKLYLAKGAGVPADSLGREQRCVLVVAESAHPIRPERLERLTDWLRIRLNDSTVVVLNPR
ncbi:MAG: DUF389 domain-containing protein [Bacteroidales bacterium]|nr:DUF389 domain-containing protein [Bacteroidales bacterium]